MLMTRRGKQPLGPDYISSCSSTNKQRLAVSLLRPHARPPPHPSLHSLSFDGYSTDLDATACLPSSVSPPAAGTSTELLLMMASLAGGTTPGPGSSLGSCCAAWSVGSLADHCPTTPSPVCSPVSSAASPPISTLGDPSFATPDQGSCIISNGASKSKISEQVQHARRAETACNFAKHHHSNATDHLIMMPTPMNPSRAAHKRRVPKPFNHKGTPAQPVALRRLLHEPNTGGNGRQLPTVCDEEEREERAYLRTRELQPVTESPRDSPVRNWNSARYNADDSSRCHCSDTDRRRRLHGSRACEVEAKPIAWKETRIWKLINELRKQEQAIEDWEEQQIGKAKQRLKNIEAKLEKRRDGATEKMQRKASAVQKKAEKRKLGVQADMAQKISSVHGAFEKISSNGKLPWMLGCC